MDEMRFLGVGLLAYFTIIASLGFAETGCGELAKRWRDEYRSALGVEDNAPFSCVANLAPETISGKLFQLAEATDFLKNTLPKFYRWVTTLIDKTLFEKNHDPNILASLSEGRVMRLYPSFFNDTSKEYRATILVHEAAHAVTIDHATCRAGEEVGWEGACDEVFTENWGGGAYNYQFLTLLQLRHQAKHHHEISKAAIDTKLKYLLLNKFNKITTEQIQKWSPVEQTKRTVPSVWENGFPNWLGVAH